METTNKLPLWFWIIAIIALLWNLMGVAAYLGNAYMTEEALAALPEGDQNYYNNLPAWVTAVFAISVFSGALGSVGLLLRKKWASLLFIVSLLTVLSQAVYNFFLQEYIELGGGRMVMPIIVIIIAAFLVWFSKNCTTRGWLK